MFQAQTNIINREITIMMADFTNGYVFINATQAKAECPIEQKLVNTAFELLIANPWLGINDMQCGCDDEYEYYLQGSCDSSEVSRKDIMKEWKKIKKEAIELCK